MAAAEAPFRISLFGGAVEKQFRASKPELDTLDWSELDPDAFSAEELARGQELWSRAAFNENRSACAAAATTRALIAAQAPLDLSAMASRFVLDELAHAEVCARVVAQLGGGVQSSPVADALDVQGPLGERPLMTAAVLAVRHYCVEETSSAPMMRATAQDANHPLLARVFHVLAKDEAMHSQLGWFFFDWCIDRLTASERATLAKVAQAAIDHWVASWPTGDDDQPQPLGGLSPRRYRERAELVVREDIVASLVSYGISVEAPSLG